MLPDGVPPPAAGRTDGLVSVGRKSVADGHFATLRIGMLSGRDFTRADDASAPAVAIVNETLARTFWPGESPIGRRLRFHDRAAHASPPSRSLDSSATPGTSASANCRGHSCTGRWPRSTGQTPP